MLTPYLKDHPLFVKASYVAVVGIESHICVSHTVLDLLTVRPKQKSAAEKEIVLLADCVSSMRPGDRQIAINRLRMAGTDVSSVEAFVYSLMRDANHPEFRNVVAAVKDHARELAALNDEEELTA